MNRTIIIYFLIILFCSNVFATHCWDITNFNSSPTLSWINGTQIPLTTEAQFQINGITIESLVLPGTTAKFASFGNYNMICNDGAAASIKPLAKLEVFDSQSNSKLIKYNTANNTCATQYSGLPYCERVGGAIQDSSLIIGVGQYDEITIPFTSDNNFENEPYIIKGHVDAKTVSGSCGNELVEKVQRNILLVANPSLFTFTPIEEVIRFYETEGTYTKEIFLTLTKNHTLNIKVDNLNLKCENDFGATCRIIDKTELEGTILDKTQDTMILTTELTIDKSNLKNQKLDPMTIEIQLDVNYSLPQSNALGSYFTSTAPKLYTIGLMDQQDFQVKIMGQSNALTECVSYDGLIGVTGPEHSPRINLRFADRGTIKADTCDLTKIDGTSNDWVYCSQNEFIFSLANKIGKIIELQSEINNELTKIDINQNKINELNQEINNYSSAKIHVRDLDLSKNKIEEHLDNFNNSFAERDGLEEFSGSPVNYGGNDPVERIQKLKELFVESDIVKFEYYGGQMQNPFIQVGQYDIEINVSNQNKNDLFIGDEINDSIDITVNLKDRIAPTINWFFYRNNMSDINESSIVSTTPTLSSTNNTSRGIVLTFNKEANITNPNTIYLVKTFAVPLFIKIENNNLITNKFFISKSITGSDEGDAFTYWTGFASNKGNGCEEISPAQSTTIKSLFYRIPDEIINIKTDGELEVRINEYQGITQGDIELLQTVIYAPLGAEATAEEITFKGPLSIYTASNECIFNDTNCQLNLNRNMSSYNVQDLYEIFDKIAEREICISEEFTGLSEKAWTLFWNEEQLLKSLNTRKQSAVSSMTGVQICNPNT